MTVLREREGRVVARKRVESGLGTPDRRRMRRKRERERTRPMAKKLEKMKSFTNARFLPFLGAFDLCGFEDGRIEEDQDVPRREEEKGMFGLGEFRKKTRFWSLVGGSVVMLRDLKKGLGMNFQVGSWEVSTWESVFLCCVCVAVVVSSEASGVCVSVLRVCVCVCVEGNWKLEIGNWKLVWIFCWVLWNCQMCFWKLASVLHKDSEKSGKLKIILSKFLGSN